MKKKWVSLLCAGLMLGSTIAVPAENMPGESQTILESLQESTEAIYEIEEEIASPMEGSAAYEEENDETLNEENSTNDETSASEISEEEVLEDKVPVVQASESVTVPEAMQGINNWVSNVVAADTFLSGVSSTGTDWFALGLGRQGLFSKASGYLSAGEGYVTEQYQTNGMLSKTKATEWHRLTFAVLASGGDPTAFGTDTSGQSVNLIADGVYNCKVGKPWKQGINGAIFALLALDTKNYEVPEDASYSREDLIAYILKKELSGGGFTLVGSKADVDITAMALQSLAPYYGRREDVTEVVDRALTWLSSAQRPDGNYSTDDFGMGTGPVDNCESTAQVLVALCALGIDPLTDSRFITDSGKTVLDGMLKFYNTSDGGFRHILEDKDSDGIPDNDSDGMACQQGLYALVAYDRFCRGETNLYDFRMEAQDSILKAEIDGTVYTAEKSQNMALEVPRNTTEIALTNIPIGSYDWAVVTVDGNSYQTEYGLADGSTPLKEALPISDGTEIAIEVHHRNSDTENWTLTVNWSADAAAKAVISQIEALPDTADLTLDDKAQVEKVRGSYDALNEDEKAQITNYVKLEAAEKQIKALEKQAAEELDAKRKAFAARVRVMEKPDCVADKTHVQQMISELNSLGTWSEEAALREKLHSYLHIVSDLEKAVDQLDQDIWNQIDPLRLDQSKADTVRSLMQRYAAMAASDRALLKNSQSLLDAADVIQALEEGTIPKQIFTSRKTTGESFTYSGSADASHPYTITFSGSKLKGTSNMNAGIMLENRTGLTISEGTVPILMQQSTLNGSMTIRIQTGQKDGSYTLYWYHPEKEVLQTVGSVTISGGYAEFTVASGGSFCLAEGEKSPTVTASTGTNGSADNNSSSGNSGSSGNTSTSNKTNTSSGNKTSGSTSNSTKKNNSTSSTKKNTTSSTAESDTITAKIANGKVSADQFESVKGTKKKLVAEGSLDAEHTYRYVFYGEDIKNVSEFDAGILSENANAENIHQLAENPFLLLIQQQGAFPGQAMLEVQTSLEDGEYLLFRYNETERKAEYVKKVTVASGTAKIILEEGGDYFIAERAKSGALPAEEEITAVAEAAVTTSLDTGAAVALESTEAATAETSEAETEVGTAPVKSRAPLYTAIAIIVAGLIIIPGTIIGMKRKAKKEELEEQQKEEQKKKEQEK